GVLAERGVPASVVERMHAIAEAHEALGRVGGYHRARGDQLVLRGLQIRLLEIAEEQPEDWSEYLRIALGRQGNDKALVQPTLAASRKTARTAEVLGEAVASGSPHVKDRAR